MPKFLNFIVAKSSSRISNSYKSYQLKLSRKEICNQTTDIKNDFKVLKNEIITTVKRD